MLRSPPGVPAAAGEQCTRPGKGSALPASHPAPLHPELVLVNMEVQEAVGTRVPVGQGWEQELTLAGRSLLHGPRAEGTLGKGGLSEKHLPSPP